MVEIRLHGKTRSKSPPPGIPGTVSPLKLTALQKIPEKFYQFRCSIFLAEVTGLFQPGDRAVGEESLKVCNGQCWGYGFVTHSYRQHGWFGAEIGDSCSTSPDIVTDPV